MIERTGMGFITTVVKVRNTKGNGKTGISTDRGSTSTHLEMFIPAPGYQERSLGMGLWCSRPGLDMKENG